jgi:hypothetical protein
MMIDSQWWESTSGAIEAIIVCLPKETQEKIADYLQLLAQVQRDKGLDVASMYSRMLSGEPAPGIQAGPERPKRTSNHLKVVADNSPA